MSDFIDQPVEVTLVDGSRWIIYYRGITSYALVIPYLVKGIAEGRVIPAHDLDRVQRRHAHINAAQIVSCREVEVDDA
jgi:hypothetical protein